MKKWLLFSIIWFLPWYAFASPPPPPADEVFKAGVVRFDPNTFTLSWDIKPGFFLYKDRISIGSPDSSHLRLGDIRFPPTETKVDKQGHQYQVYRGHLSLPVPVLGLSPGESLLELHYQGCSDDGFCYPPEMRQLVVGINTSLELATVSFYKAPVSVVKVAEKKEVNRFDLLFSKHHWPLIFLTFFGFGLLLAFTPCVLPMVPVLSGIIVGHGADLTTRKAFLLSLSYVLSMATTYAIVGGVVAELGSNLQIIMQSPWAITLFSLCFVVLSLSMFGYFELKLPVAWQAKLASINRSHANGHYAGAAVMGCLSTLILSPCVTAPLIGVLGYIARSGDVLMGCFSLFFLGLGMGTPLLLIGLSAGRWLPKAGQWMNAVKAFFGVMLLAVAIYLLARILPGPLVMGLWSALLIFSGIYAGAMVPGRSNQEKFSQAAGIMLLVYGLLVLVGASMGGSNPLQPLATWPTKEPVSERLAQYTVSNVEALETAVAESEGKPVLLDFYADWCASCVVMENTVFKNPEVRAALADFTVIKVDLSANDKNSNALLNLYHVVAPPSFIFLDKQGDELEQLRLVGEVDEKDMIQQLERAID